MPLPNRSQVHVNQPLTNLSIAFLQSTSGFVCNKVFPIVPVQKSSDLYYEWPINAFNQNVANELAPGAMSSEIGYNLNTSSYATKVYSSAHPITEQVLANADEALDLERAGVNLIMHSLLQRKERDWAAQYFTSGVWGTDITGAASGSVSAGQTVHWDDYTNSTPILDIRTGMDTVQENTGLRPNVMVVNRKVFSALIDNPEIIDRINANFGSPTSPVVANERTLAALFGLEEVLVADAIKDTSNLGGTATQSFIAGNNALLAYRAPTPGLMTPSAGYTFSWRNLLGAGNEFGVVMSRFDGDNQRERHVAVKIEGQMAYDQKLVASDLGYFFNAILS